MLARATPAELARIPRIRAEFRPWRPLAFELQRRGYAARGWVLRGSSASVLHGRWPSRGVAEKARIGRDLFRLEDGPPAAKPATPLLSLRWTFRAKRACVVITDAEPARLAPLTPPAPMGLRGVWVVAARCCASPPGIMQPRTPPAPPQPWADLPKVLELARRPNAVIKVSGACTLSREPYPFPDIWDPLARVFDA